MSKQTEALKLALEALNRNDYLGWQTNIHVRQAIREALAEQPAQQQEPVSCHVCNEVHTILDADDSKIIRNAADGYPDGRASRVLTLQERVTALCVYAADWRRWCLEKENAPPASKPWVGLSTIELDEIDAPIRERGHATIAEIYQAIEAKLREKNA